MTTPPHPDPVLDDRLSFRARGVHERLRRMADVEGRVPSAFTQLQAMTPTEGQRAVRTALGELERHGYIHSEQVFDSRNRYAGVIWRLTHLVVDHKELAA